MAPSSALTCSRDKTVGSVRRRRGSLRKDTISGRPRVLPYKNRSAKNLMAEPHGALVDPAELVHVSSHVLARQLRKRPAVLLRQVLRRAHVLRSRRPGVSCTRQVLLQLNDALVHGGLLGAARHGNAEQRGPPTALRDGTWRFYPPSRRGAASSRRPSLPWEKALPPMGCRQSSAEAVSASAEGREDHGPSRCPNLSHGQPPPAGWTGGSARPSPPLPDARRGTA